MIKQNVALQKFNHKITIIAEISSGITHVHKLQTRGRSTEYSRNTQIKCKNTKMLNREFVSYTLVGLECPDLAKRSPEDDGVGVDGPSERGETLDGGTASECLC